VVAYDLKQGLWRELSGAECGFGYRDSIFRRAPQGRWLITAVRFALPRVWQPKLQYADLRERAELQGDAVTPEAIFHAVCEIRRSKLPDATVLPNAGSFFKNPVIKTEHYEELLTKHADIRAWPQAQGMKLAAGWLIDRAGWKGRRLGPVGMHERHALVLVNYGNATARHVSALAEAVQRD